MTDRRNRRRRHKRHKRATKNRRAVRKLGDWIAALNDLYRD